MITKLALIQQELCAPKNQYNSYGKYNYRSCEDILEGLKPCLEKVGCALTITDEIVQVGERYYVKATATLHDNETDKKISNVAYAREELTKKGMDASQITGAASSYARKYALNGLFCIDDVKDADARDNRQKEAKAQKQAEAEIQNIENSVIDEIKAKALIERCTKESVDISTVLEFCEKKTLEEITEKLYSDINNKWYEIKSKDLTIRCEKENVSTDKILELYKVSKFTDLTEKMYANINANWEKIKEA